MSDRCLTALEIKEEENKQLQKEVEALQELCLKLEEECKLLEGENINLNREIKAYRSKLDKLSNFIDENLEGDK